MIVYSAADVLKQGILPETIGKRIGKSLNIIVLHDVAILEGRISLGTHSGLLFYKNSKLSFKHQDLYRLSRQNKKYSEKLDISRSLLRIIEMNLEYTFAR